MEIAITLREGNADDMLLRLAKETYEQKGKLIIPAFSVGRTQEVVYRLNKLFEDNQLPPMEVFVDSPLAVQRHDGLSRAHRVFGRRVMLEQLLSEEDQDPLGFRDLHYHSQSSPLQGTQSLR